MTSPDLLLDDKLQKKSQKTSTRENELKNADAGDQVPKEVVLEVVKDASEAKQHQVKIAERVETTLETSCEIFYTTFAKREATSGDLNNQF